MKNQDQYNGYIRYKTNQGKYYQNGMALAISMVLLLAVTILGVTGANEAILSQKMATNHNSQTKAFFAAQEGVAKAIQLAGMQKIKQAASSGNVSRIKSSWKQIIHKYQISPHQIGKGNNSSQYHLSRINGPNGIRPFWNKTKHVIQVESHGKAAVGAIRNIAVQISPATLSKTNSPFLAGVIGRKHVSIKGRPVIDSYNSNYGSYNNPVTVNHKTFKNSSIYSSKLRSVVVQTCMASIKHPTYGNIVINGNASVYGKVVSAHKFVRHGKPFLQSSANSSPKNHKTLKIKRCNTFQNNGSLSRLFTKVQNSSKTQLLNKKYHTLGKSGQKTFLKTSGGNLSNLNIAGNVTLFVNGNLSLKGNLHIGSSASLRLLVTGTTKLTAGTTINVNGSFVRKNANGKATPAIALYSTYKSNKGKAGVKLAGHSSSHIAVYAPNSKIQITGKGSIYGSVVGQKITHTGHASIHYNTALKNIHLSSGSSSSNSAKLKSWHQL